MADASAWASPLWAPTGLMSEQLKFCLYQDDDWRPLVLPSVCVSTLGANQPPQLRTWLPTPRKLSTRKLRPRCSIALVDVRLEEADPLITSLMQDKDAIQEVRHVSPSPAYAKGLGTTPPSGSCFTCCVRRQ